MTEAEQDRFDTTGCKSTMIAAIALANKIARIAWAMMARNETHRAPLPAAA